MTRPAALLIALLLTACGGSATLDDDINGLQASMDGKDFAAVIAAAPAVLARCESEGADDSKAWRVESLRIKALARSGQGAETAKQLEAAAAAYADKLNAKLFAQMGGYCMEAGDNLGAIAVLDAGAKRFPADAAAIKAQIEVLKTQAAGDSEAMAALKALGYL